MSNTSLHTCCEILHAWLLTCKDAGYDVKGTLSAKLPEINKSFPASSSDIFLFLSSLCLMTLPSFGYLYASDYAQLSRYS